MNRIRKVVAAVKEIDTEGKTKLGFSGIVARGDINKEDIVSTKNRLEKYYKGNKFFFINNSNIDASSQLAQRRCDNVVTTSLLTLSQRCGTVENESCADVSFRRCDNVALQRCQDVASTLLQRRHNIKHWISTRPFYYGLF